MRTQAQLCHIDANRCVVLVTAYGETDVMGSALGEGATAEQAEDRALQGRTSQATAGERTRTTTNRGPHT